MAETNKRAYQKCIVFLDVVFQFGFRDTGDNYQQTFCFEWVISREIYSIFGNFGKHCRHVV